MELVKKRFNKGLEHNLYFYKDSNKNEVDIIYKSGRKLILYHLKLNHLKLFQKVF